VLTLSGKHNVLSNIAQDYGGKDSMQDATCECSEPSVRKYGLPCAHNVAHVEKAGLTPESIVHWKDTTVAWKMAYEGLEWPVLSMVNVDTSDLVNPMVQYPPVVAPKCGRPVRVRRIMGAEEAGRKQKRARAVLPSRIAGRVRSGGTRVVANSAPCTRRRSDASLHLICIYLCIYQH
jgi:hypothetical protein